MIQRITVYTTTSETLCDGLQGYRGLVTVAELAEEHGELAIDADGVELTVKAGEDADAIEARIYAAQA